MVEFIHESQKGKDKCLLHARDSVFGQGIFHDIQKLMKKCGICQIHAKLQPIIVRHQEASPFPWHTIARDMFYWKQQDFIVVADFFIVRKIHNSTLFTFAIELSMIVTEFGLPFIIKSDNGLCYNSKEFQEVFLCYCINHQTSSPLHLGSDGFAEHCVGVVK